MSRRAPLLTTAALMACSHAPAVLPANWEALQGSDPSSECDAATTRRYADLDQDGDPIHVYERHRCGVVELRLEERYDPQRDARLRELYRDRDHDGVFEDHLTLPVTVR